MSDADPFDTERLRRLTLQAWRDNPARFREDANTEEDYARGYYRDRIIVELAQNAADVAFEDGGAVYFSLQPDALAPSGWSLRAANTGRALTADGAASLSSLRTSAKRELGDGDAPAGRSIGHFGVGFSAVRAVSDDILVRSVSGGVRFSLENVRRELAGLDGGADLAAEIARRGSELPILRLPWPIDALQSGGEMATEITVRLRDEAAVALVRALLDDVSDELLIALPRLREISIAIDAGPVRHFADVDERWHITRRGGTVPSELLATLPVEERERGQWQVIWASERGTGQQGDLLATALEIGRGGEFANKTLLAPTPTDEPITVPGLLIVSLPLEPTRRRVRPGPVTDWIIGQVGQAAAEHARELTDPLTLVPVGLPAGPVDSALHESMREALADAPLLATLDGKPVAPRDAQMIVLSAGESGSLRGAIPIADRVALNELAAGQEGIVDVPRHRLTQAAAVGVGARNVADVITEMPAGRSPQRWHKTYEALTGLTGEIGGAAALASLPIPLASGRVVSGPRGAYSLSDDLPDFVINRLADWGLRIIDAAAAHPLLEALGATSVPAAALLDEPVVAAMVAYLRSEILELDSIEGAEDDVLVILSLVASAVRNRPPGDPVVGPIRPWLPDLPLRNAYGEHYGAGGLYLPGSAAEEIFAPEELQPLGADLAPLWDADVWRAAGVRDDLVIVGGAISLDAWDIDSSIDHAMENISLAVLDRFDEYLDALGDYWLDGHDPEPGETV
ncbi:MAG TPA: hypothetical protein VK030_05785, partial [Actinomycetales bacterium]|nr:hypothetical protein [Actinomycetales bacterium]